MPLNEKSQSQYLLQISKLVYRVEIPLIVFGSVLFSYLRFGFDLPQALFQFPGTPKVIFYPILWFFCMYRNHAWDRSIILDSNSFYTRVFSSSFQVLLAFSTFAYITKFPISRVWVLLNTLGICMLLIIFRFILRSTIINNVRSNLSRSYLYIGTEKSLPRVQSEFNSIYGFIPTVNLMSPPENDDVDLWLKKYENLISEYKPYGVIVGVGEIQNAGILRRVIDTKRDQIIDLLIISRLSPILNRFESINSLGIMRIRESAIVGGGAVLKRIFDLVFSIIIFILISPLLILVAISIKLSSKGPIFYIDSRVGMNGETFSFPKFRSMYVGADKDRQSILGKPDESMAQRYKTDPRITPVGRFIRRWSIDELPQFWCVLKGTMSVVGPRPILIEELDLIPHEFQIRFIAKPGLTGLWQVTGRKEVAWEDRMMRDITYIDNWSLYSDLVLVAKTVLAIIKGDGAY